MSWKKLSQKWPVFLPVWHQKKVKHTFSSKILLTHLTLPYASSNHQVWSHSAHKRPRNHHKNRVFLPPCELIRPFGGCRFRTLSTQNRYLDFPDTKTPLPTIFYYHLCSNHRIWSQSAHKRPRNCQNSYFFSNCPCTLRPQKDPKSCHEWVRQIAQYTRTTGPIDYLSIWKVALPPK